MTLREDGSTLAAKIFLFEKEIAMTASQELRIRIATSGREGARLGLDQLTALDSELDLLVSQIRGCKDVSAAERYLTDLGDLQELLSIVHFKYHEPISDKQRALVRRFDRFDDPGLRAEVFRAIAENSFP
jgi:hypothetical protein